MVRGFQHPDEIRQGEPQVEHAGNQRQDFCRDDRRDPDRGDERAAPHDPALRAILAGHGHWRRHLVNTRERGLCITVGRRIRNRFKLINIGSNESMPRASDGRKHRRNPCAGSCPTPNSLVRPPGRAAPARTGRSPSPRREMARPAPAPPPPCRSASSSTLPAPSASPASGWGAPSPQGGSASSS